MRRLVVSLVIAGALAAPATAGAYSPSADVQAKSAQLAEQLSPGGTCAGRTTVVVDADLSAERTDDGRHVVGQAFTSTCTILMGRELRDPIAWCIVRVHEDLHLDGYEHGDYRVAGGVMDDKREANTWRYGPCVRAVAPRLSRARATAYTRGLPGNTGTARCRSQVAPDTWRCTTRVGERGDTTLVWYRVRLGVDGIRHS